MCFKYSSSFSVLRYCSKWSTFILLISRRVLEFDVASEVERSTGEVELPFVFAFWGSLRFSFGPDFGGGLFGAERAFLQLVREGVAVEGGLLQDLQ